VAAVYNPSYLGDLALKASLGKMLVRLSSQQNKRRGCVCLSFQPRGR
jgi:hypothetical protein